MSKGTLTVSVCVMLVAGCTRQTESERGNETAAPTTGGLPLQLQVQMVNREGSHVGTITAENAEEGVRFRGRVTGLTAGERGFHIHTVGRCDPPDFSSAGGHYNPTNAHHGEQNPQTPKPHLGDLGNLNVGEDGVANIDVVAENTTLGEGENSLRMGQGSALVIHAGSDDLRSDPSGNSGDRVACGVISTARM